MAETKQNELWTLYQNGLRFQQLMGFQSKWPEFVRFYDSDQWPKVTNETRHLPRPVFNVIEFDIRHKRAFLLSQAQKMIFLPEDTVEGSEDEAVQAADDFSDFAQMTWEDMEYERITDRVMLSSPIVGTGIWHFYWDNQASGGTYTKYKGKIAGEYIRPNSFIVSNPKCEDEQKQQRIIVASTYETAEVREMARANGTPEREVRLIVPDGYDQDEHKYDAERQRQDGSETTTVLTEYHRENGEVYFSRATRAAMVKQNTRLNGNRMYPIVVNNWKEREGCIYGFGEAEDLIPAQRAINFMFALHLMGAQLMSFPKLITLPGALGSQVITNIPGEMLTDNIGDGNTRGFYYLQPPAFSNATVDIAKQIVDLTRTLKGVTEVMSADRMVSDMAASAIMALQSQAKMPLEFQQKALRRCHWRTGRIWEEFYKNFQTTPRPFMVRNPVGVEETKIFRGSDHAGKTFRLHIEVGPSAEFTEGLQQATLDKLHFESKEIDLNTYIDLMPANTLPNREELKRKLERQREQSGIIQQMIAAGGIHPAAAMQLAALGIFPQAVGQDAQMMLAQMQQQEQGGGAPNAAQTG